MEKISKRKSISVEPLLIKSCYQIKKTNFKLENADVGLQLLLSIISNQRNSRVLRWCSFDGVGRPFSNNDPPHTFNVLPHTSLVQAPPPTPPAVSPLQIRRLLSFVFAVNATLWHNLHSQHRPTPAPPPRLQSQHGPPPVGGDVMSR